MDMTVTEAFEGTTELPTETTAEGSKGKQHTNNKKDQPDNEDDVIEIIE